VTGDLDATGLTKLADELPRLEVAHRPNTGCQAPREPTDDAGPKVRLVETLLSGKVATRLSTSSYRVSHVSTVSNHGRRHRATDVGAAEACQVAGEVDGRISSPVGRVLDASRSS